MPRIQSTSDAGGGSPYEFPYNPAGYDGQDNANVTEVQILHGAPAWQNKKWDGRPRTMKWYLVGATTTADATGRTDMLDTMRGWVGTVRYFNFQNLNRINERWPVTDTWKKARVIDLRAEVREGKGQLYYDSVELIIQPEQ